MNIPEQKERPPFTWALLKDFCNGLTDEQLKQEVIVPQDESYIKILYASDLGEDQYNFTEHDYSCARADFDGGELDMYDQPNYQTIEEALENEDYTITPGTNVYLFDE